MVLSKKRWKHFVDCFNWVWDKKKFKMSTTKRLERKELRDLKNKYQDWFSWIDKDKKIKKDYDRLRRLKKKYL